MSKHRIIRPSDVLVAALTLAMGVGCTSDDTAADECGGNGELHDDHCHCDEGFVQSSDDPTECIPDDGGDPDTPGPSSTRLAVTDAETGEITLISLDDGSVAGAFELSGPARIYATESGRFLAAFQGEANRVDFFDSGIALEEHGDHVDTLVNAPRELGYQLVGADLATENPVHFVSHNGYVTIHFDGTWDDAGQNHVMSRNLIIREAELMAETPAPALELEGLPQHGVSVVTSSGHVLITEPSLDRSVSTLPSGVSVRSLSDGSLLQTFNDANDEQASCWGLHGEASLGSSVLFGCHQELDGGALMVSYDEAGGEFTARKVTYPGYPDAPDRTSVIASHPKSPYFVGQWGTFAFPDNFYDGLVRIAPDAERIESAHTLELGSVYCQFGFERDRGATVAALTRNGKLHIVDVEGWSVVRTVDVVEDLEADGACAGSLLMGYGHAYVSDRDAGTIVEIDLESGTVARTFSVAGAPGSMALLGGFGIPGQSAR